MRSVPMTDAEILSAAIAASGLSARRFAAVVAWRDERTIRRWLAGDDVPRCVIARCTWLLALPERRRVAYIRTCVSG